MARFGLDSDRASLRCRGWLATVLLVALVLAAPAAAQNATPVASPAAGGAPAQLAEIPMAPGGDQPEADPDATLTLNLGEEIDSGDPQVFAFLNEIEIGSKVFAPLLALNEENEVAAHAAEAMEVSADGTTYTFILRNGMTYTDGQPVTAANYAYAIKRACDPEVAGNYSNILFDIVGCEDWRLADPAADPDALPALEAALDGALVATDERTLRIQLRQSAGYFPYVMATWVTYPSRQDLVEAGGADWWQNPQYYVGNGPFRLVSHTPGQDWVFERNEDYFKGSPGIARLVYEQVSAPETALLAYQQGELDVIGPSATQLPQLEADPTLAADLQRQVGANTFYMAFNNAQAPFDDVRVRQAFAAALNREQYINQIANGVGRPAGTFLYPGIPGYQERVQQTYDPERARALLAEAGYPNGEGFPTQQLRYNAESPAGQQIVTFWSQNLRDVLNVDIQPTPIDSTELQSLRTNRDPSLVLYTGNWFEDYPHPQNWLSLVFGPGSTRAPLGWDDPTYNDLVRRADGLPLEEALPLYEEADAYLAEQAPVAFYLHGEALVLISPSVQGYVTYPTNVIDTVYQMEKIYKPAA